MRFPSAPVDVRTAILKSRRVPCICPRQHEKNPPLGRAMSASTHRGRTVERVGCDTCAREWTRINAAGDGL